MDVDALKKKVSEEFFNLICILLIKTADIFAVLYFAASQAEYAEKSNTKAQSAQFT